jgi:hypothetical protein
MQMGYVLLVNEDTKGKFWEIKNSKSFGTTMNVFNRRRPLVSASPSRMAGVGKCGAVDP